MKALLPPRASLRYSAHSCPSSIRPQHVHMRCFASSPSTLAMNRVYEASRSLPALQTVIALSTTSRRPLLALFTVKTSSPVNARVRSLILSLLEEEKIGERDGGVGYTEVEVDAPDCLAEDVQGMYLITSVPTLMAFSRGEPQQLTKVSDIAELQDREFMRLWIENEARRGGAGGAGGHGLFGGMFGLGSSS